MTHNPEKPPFHLRNRNHISNVLDHVWHEESADPKGRMEAREHVAHRAEEALHREVGNVNLERTLSPENV